MANTSKNIQVPGAEPSDQPEETVTVSKSMLDSLMARMNQLEQKPARISTAESEANLPDQSEVDTKTIKFPVLSKQGWVVPDGFGTPAAK